VDHWARSCRFDQRRVCLLTEPGQAHARLHQCTVADPNSEVRAEQLRDVAVPMP
jgi:hypothetical protein